LKPQFKGISVFNWESNKYLKKYADNKALRGNSPQNPPHEGSTAGSCVSAIVLGNQKKGIRSSIKQKEVNI
jgi:hypothetical protein